MCTFLSFQTHLKWHIIDIRLHNVRKPCALKNAHLCVAQACTGREVQTRLELTVTGTAPNSRQQSKTVIYKLTKLHRWVWRGVCLTKQSKRKEKAPAMAIISSLYKAKGQKDKRCAEIYTIFQPRIKSWTSTIIWDKYNVIYFFGKLCKYMALLCRTVFNFKWTLFNECTNQNVG